MASRQVVQNVKEAKDKGFIIIDGKPYKVNQSSPSIELISSATEISLFQKDYTNNIKLIERIQNKLDDILSKESEDLEEILREYQKHEELRDAKVDAIHDMLSRVSAMLKTVLVYYLGESVYENSLKDLGFLELINIATQCRTDAPQHAQGANSVAS